MLPQPQVFFGAFYTLLRFSFSTLVNYERKSFIALTLTAVNKHWGVVS